MQKPITVKCFLSDFGLLFMKQSKTMWWQGNKHTRNLFYWAPVTPILGANKLRYINVTANLHIV